MENQKQYRLYTYVGFDESDGKSDPYFNPKELSGPSSSGIFYIPGDTLLFALSRNGKSDATLDEFETDTAVSLYTTFHAAVLAMSEEKMPGLNLITIRVIDFVHASVWFGNEAVMKSEFNPSRGDIKNRHPYRLSVTRDHFHNLKVLYVAPMPTEPYANTKWVNVSRSSQRARRMQAKRERSAKRPGLDEMDVDDDMMALEDTLEQNMSDDLYDSGDEDDNVPVAMENDLPLGMYLDSMLVNREDVVRGKKSELDLYSPLNFQTQANVDPKNLIKEMKLVHRELSNAQPEFEKVNIKQATGILNHDQHANLPGVARVTIHRSFYGQRHKISLLPQHDLSGDHANFLAFCRTGALKQAALFAWLRGVGPWPNRVTLWISEHSKATTRLQDTSRINVASAGQKNKQYDIPSDERMAFVAIQVVPRLRKKIQGGVRMEPERVELIASADNLSRGDPCGIHAEISHIIATMSTANLGHGGHFIFNPEHMIHMGGNKTVPSTMLRDSSNLMGRRQWSKFSSDSSFGSASAKFFNAQSHPNSRSLAKRVNVIDLRMKGLLLRYFNRQTTYPDMISSSIARDKRARDLQYAPQTATDNDPQKSTHRDMEPLSKRQKKGYTYAKSNPADKGGAREPFSSAQNLMQVMQVDEM